MRLRRDKDILRFFGMSLGMILLGLIISFFFQPIFIGVGLILGGLALLVTGLYASTKPKEYFIPDERITKNTDRAGHHAFWLVLLVITSLNMIEIYSPTIKYLDASTVIMLVGIYSFFILRWYYNKKGE
ncbi:MAG: hypothetical protein Q7U60_04820 [Candidatus Methanoperedens sp.]|nr:hypothetical protein [Candidatus Methanoperedens sp.]